MLWEMEHLRMRLTAGDTLWKEVGVRLAVAGSAEFRAATAIVVLADVQGWRTTSK